MGPVHVDRSVAPPALKQYRIQKSLLFTLQSHQLRNSRRLEKENPAALERKLLQPSKSDDSTKMPTLNDQYYKETEVQQLFIPEVLESLPDETILQEFSALYEATLAYVNKFYTMGPVKSESATQTMIEQAGAGILLPWPQIEDLLSNGKTRSGILTMCIAKTMLGRSLLLRLGAGCGQGATFLPPEIIDCFQSFCSGNSAATLDGREPKPINFALLSRWKQMSATLLHSTYVTDAFSPFDGRTVNIERAMADLSPLLALYALPDDSSPETGTRLSELRAVLRKGARLAFTLFSQPCLWKFDWYDEREIGAEEGQTEPGKVQRAGSMEVRSGNKRFNLSLEEIVIWPRLVRVMDHKGCRLVAERAGSGFGEKRYLVQVL